MSTLLEIQQIKLFEHEEIYAALWYTSNSAFIIRVFSKLVFLKLNVRISNNEGVWSLVITGIFKSFKYSPSAPKSATSMTSMSDNALTTFLIFLLYEWNRYRDLSLRMLIPGSADFTQKSPPLNLITRIPSSMRSLSILVSSEAASTVTICPLWSIP